MKIVNELQLDGGRSPRAIQSGPGPIEPSTGLIVLANQQPVGRQNGMNNVGSSPTHTFTAAHSSCRGSTTYAAAMNFRDRRRHA
jgi:hypothetical protein